MQCSAVWSRPVEFRSSTDAANYMHHALKVHNNIKPAT